MSPVEAIANNASAVSDIDHLKLWVPFVGGLLGGLLGSPILELFKDRLAAWRIWQVKRKEVIEALRFINTHLEAFWELRRNCFSERIDARNRSDVIGTNPDLYLDPLQKFDLTETSKSIKVLIELRPGESEKKAIAQYLVQQLLVLIALIKSIQSAGRSCSENLLKEADDRFKELQFFLVSAYAEACGVQGMRLVPDSKVMVYKIKRSQAKQAEADANLKAAIKAYNATNPRFPIPLNDGG
jgi:hypothetical protein